jgi:hypothetical protein
MGEALPSPSPLPRAAGSYLPLWALLWGSPDRLPIRPPRANGYPMANNPFEGIRKSHTTQSKKNWETRPWNHVILEADGADYFTDPTGDLGRFENKHSWDMTTLRSNFAKYLTTGEPCALSCRPRVSHSIFSPPHQLQGICSAYLST